MSIFLINVFQLAGNPHTGEGPFFGKRPVNCPMDRGMREDPGSVRVQEAASGSPVRVGFQFAGASSAISVMFMSGNLLRTSVR